MKDHSTSPLLDSMTRKAAVNFYPLSSASKIPDGWIEQIREPAVKPDKYKQAIEHSLPGLGLLFGVYNPHLSGFLWMELDHLENMLYVHCYSVSKRLWHTSSHLNSLIKLLEWLKSILKVKKVRWFTNRPGLYRKLGYGASKRILMEA